MKIKLVGYELVDYESKRTGKPVRGMNFYGIDLSTKKDSLDGNCLFDQFLSEDYCSDIDIDIGSVYEVVFDTVLFAGRYQSKFVGLRKEVVSNEEE